MLLIHTQRTFFKGRPMSNDNYVFYFQKGQEWLHEGRDEDARIAFLKAARLLYERAKESPDAVSQRDWYHRAKRMQSLALQLAGKNSGSTSSVSSSEKRMYFGTSSENFGAKNHDTENHDTEKTGKENPASDSGSRWQLTETPDITFADIAGLETVKQIISQRVIFPLQNPALAAAYKRRPGAGIMMYGPPGTGKTMMAKAIAGELKIPFFSIQSSSILSKWLGEAEQNFRDLFQEARENAPSVLFFDEAEALLSKRGGDSGAMDRIIPEFLAQVDGISRGAEGLLLIGATNRPWDLDPAALRPGRFGEKIYIPLPDAEAREFLLRKKLAEMPGAENLDFNLLAARTEGFSGADINGLVYRIIDPVFARAVDSGKQVPILLSDVEKAVAGSSPSVSRKDLAVFEKYRCEN